MPNLYQQLPKWSPIVIYISPTVRQNIKIHICDKLVLNLLLIQSPSKDIEQVKKTDLSKW